MINSFSFLSKDLACIEKNRRERVNRGNICFPWAKYLWKGIGAVWDQAIFVCYVWGNLSMMHSFFKAQLAQNTELGHVMFGVFQLT